MRESVYDVIDPATLEVVGQAPHHDEADVREAVAAAQSVAGDWAADRDMRRSCLRSIAAAIRDDEDRLSRILSREQGKPLAQALSEFRAGADLFEYYAELQWNEVEDLEPRSGRELQVQHRPVGLVGTITPWNFPISLLCVKLAPALVSGCTVIAKPAPTTPLSTIALVDVAVAHLPPGVLQVRTSPRRTVNVALTTTPAVRKISFTGSTEVGTAVAAQAAQSVKRVTLELGGNDPAIVLDDANIEFTARQIAGSAFRNAGQVCMAVKRVYAPRHLADELADAIAAVALDYSIGHGILEGVTMGPMHNANQLELVRSMILEASDEGARIVTGNEPGTDLPGHFLAPTVLARATDGMRLVDQEQFGNALPVVGYDNLDSTLEQLSQEDFGLGASVWSPDIDRAREIASKIEAGTVWINQHTVVESDAPFGGWKSSGLGRERGRWGLQQYLEPRTVNARPHA